MKNFNRAIAIINNHSIDSGEIAWSEMITENKFLFGNKAGTSIIIVCVDLESCVVLTNDEIPTIANELNHRYKAPKSALYGFPDMIREAGINKSPKQR